MDRFVYLNGQILDGSEAPLASFSSAALYGKGIFTTVSLIDSQPFLWNKHWRRLTANAEQIGLDLTGHSEASTRKALDHLVATNKLTGGRARIAFLDERPSPIWLDGDKGKTSLSLITAPRREAGKNLRVTVSPYPINSRSPLAGIKSSNYLENILAIDEARTRGFDEAIRLNESGIVTSGCMANVFWLKDGRFHTPALLTGCLPGTTREFLIENVESDEVEAGIGEIKNADAVFLTSAGLGIVAAAEFNGEALSASDHPILRLIEQNA